MLPLEFAHLPALQVVGMTELNGSAPRQIRSRGPLSFAIEDTSRYGKYIRGGWATQVKMPRDLAFKPLSAMAGGVGREGGPAVAELLVTDTAKEHVLGAVHAGFAALHAFAASHDGELPNASLPSDVEAILAHAADVTGAVLSDADATAVRALVRSARGNLAPMGSVIGGIAAQEVLKGVSGKFTPLRQWLYFDAVEALPALPSDAAAAAADTSPAGSRYDGQIAVFGRAFQGRLLSLRTFLVGAGAIGCEMLKTWAAMGVGAGEGGGVVVTDMDRIERSNLSRQFLFRPEDIGKAKSTAGAEAARRLNPDMHVTPYETRVGPENEELFNDAFWES